MPFDHNLHWYNLKLLRLEFDCVAVLSVPQLYSDELRQAFLLTVYVYVLVLCGLILDLIRQRVQDGLDWSHTLPVIEATEI